MAPKLNEETFDWLSAVTGGVNEKGLFASLFSVLPKLMVDEVGAWNVNGLLVVKESFFFSVLELVVLELKLNGETEVAAWLPSGLLTSFFFSVFVVDGKVNAEVLASVVVVEFEAGIENCPSMSCFDSSVFAVNDPKEKVGAALPTLPELPNTNDFLLDCCSSSA